MSDIDTAALNTSMAQLGNIASSKINYKQAKKLMSLQQDYWRQQFDIVNAYNNPKMQLQRLYDAGINPLYNSDFSGNSSASLSVPTPSNPAPVDLRPNLLADMDAARAYRFNKSLEDVQSEYWKYKAEHEKQAARESGANADAIPIRTKAEFSESVARCENLFSQTDKNKEEIAEIRANITRNNAYLDLQMQDLKLRIAYYFLEGQKFDFEKEWRNYANATDRMNAVTNANMYKLGYDQFQWQKGQDVIQRNMDWRRIGQNQQQINQRSKELEIKAQELDVDKFRSYVEAGKESTSMLGLFSHNGVNFMKVKAAESELQSIMAVLLSKKVPDDKKVILQKRAENIENAVNTALNLGAARSGFQKQRKRTDLDFVGNSQPYKIGLNN